MAQSSSVREQNSNSHGSFRLLAQTRNHIDTTVSGPNGVLQHLSEYSSQPNLDDGLSDCSSDVGVPLSAEIHARYRDNRHHIHHRGFHSNDERRYSFENMSVGKLQTLLPGPFRNLSAETSLNLTSEPSSVYEHQSVIIKSAIDVKNWPSACPVVHLDIANDFELSGERQFMRLAFFFYWFLVGALILHAIATLFSAMTSAVGGNPIVMSIAFYGFSAGFFWFFFTHFYLIYYALLYRKKKLFWLYFFHTLVIFFGAMFLLLGALCDIMVLAQPLAPGSAVPIPLETAFPMAIEAGSVAVWFTVCVLSFLLIRSTYFWYTLPEDVERLMREQERLRSDMMEQPIWVTIRQLIFENRTLQAFMNPEDIESPRTGEGYQCELIIRPDRLSVNGTLFLSRNHVHFCAEARVFEYLITRIIPVSQIQGVSKTDSHEIVIKCDLYKQPIRLQFPKLDKTCDKAFLECESLWKQDDLWVWDNQAVIHQVVVECPVGDISLVSKARAHKNRARDRKFSSLPPSMVAAMSDPESDGNLHVPWPLTGHEPDLSPIIQAFACHGLTEADWERLLAGISMVTVKPKKILLRNSKRPDLWHIVSGRAVFRTGGRIIAEAEENSIIGVSPFLLWSSRYVHGNSAIPIIDEEDEDEKKRKIQMEDDDDDDDDDEKIVQTNKKKESRRWAWVVDGDKPLKAFRFNHRWIVTMLEQNPSLCGPFYRYLCHLLSDRVDITDLHIMSIAQNRLQEEPGPQELTRNLNNAAIYPEETLGFVEKNAIQRHFSMLFKLPRSETFLLKFPCTSWVSIMKLTAEKAETRSGTLFVSFHHLCFEADKNAMARKSYSWRVAFDEVLDMKYPQIKEGVLSKENAIELALRGNRKIIFWNLQNLPSVMETLTILWKDSDLATSFQPPKIANDVLIALTELQTHETMIEPLIDLGERKEEEDNDIPIFLRSDPGYFSYEGVSNTNPDNNEKAKSYADDDDDDDEDDDNNEEDSEDNFEDNFNLSGPSITKKVDEKDILHPDEMTLQHGLKPRHLEDSSDSDDNRETDDGGVREYSKANTKLKEGVLKNLAQLFGQKKKGHDKLREEMEAAEKAGRRLSTSISTRVFAWERLSLADKKELFDQAPIIGMRRNDIVLSYSTFNRNDPGIYYIEQGKVRVQYMINNGTSRVLIRSLGQGSIFGVQGLLTCLPPRATFVVDCDRANIKHMSAVKLVQILEHANADWCSKFYREIAFELAFSPSTMLFSADKWEAYPY